MPSRSPILGQHREGCWPRSRFLTLTPFSPSSLFLLHDGASRPPAQDLFRAGCRPARQAKQLLGCLASLPCLASPAADSTDMHPLALLSPLQSPTRARSTMLLSSSRTTQVRLASSLGSRKAGREGMASGPPLGGNASVACASRPIPPFPSAASVPRQFSLLERPELIRFIL